MGGANRNLVVGLLLLVAALVLLTGSFVDRILEAMIYLGAVVLVVLGIVVLAGRDKARQTLGIVLLVCGLALLLIPELGRALARLGSVAAGLILLVWGIVYLARVGRTHPA